MTRMFCVLGAAFIAASAAYATEKPMKLEAMPPKVQEAIRGEAAGATIKRTLVEVENGKTLYEAETVRDGRTRDFVVDAAGAVVEIEEEIDPASAPAPVKAAFEKAADGGRIGRLERVTRRGTVTAFEGSVVAKNGKKRSLAVKPDGTPTK